jgi:RNA polymerase sigma factor (TIGR02999 family)
MPDPDVTRALEAVERGEPMAASQLLPLVYDELRRLAGQKMAQEASDHTLQPTALVHEAYLRLVGRERETSWQNRGHFYAAAAEAMRRVLIEAARRRDSLKRGGDRLQVEFSAELMTPSSGRSECLLALDAALKKMEQADPAAYRLVMLRYFGGLTVDEAAAALGVSARTAKRNWAYARAWLQREIETP